MFFGSGGSGFFLSVVAEEGLCSADGFAASCDDGDLIGNGFANAVPDASKPASTSEVGLNIGKETSKQFRCPTKRGGTRSPSALTKRASGSCRTTNLTSSSERPIHL